MTLIMQSSFVQQVKAFMEGRDLIREGEGIVVAVSGGADSMALAHLLLDLREAWNLRLTVAHLDHDLRGEAGRRDLAFVRNWAASVGLPFIAGRQPVALFADERGTSLEAAAREVRYAFLSQTALSQGAGAVATGHTEDDQAETILLRLLRGSGAAGLAGMAPLSVRQGMRLIRPMLERSREEVLAYLREKGQSFCEDASNLDRRFLRNRVRHELMPLLVSGFHADVRKRLVRTAELLREENDWMEAITQEALREMLVDGHPGGLRTSALAAIPLAARRRVVRAWLAVLGAPAPDYKATSRILGLLGDEAGSKQVPLPDGWWVERVYDLLKAEGPLEARAMPAEAVLKCPGETAWPELGLRIRVSETVGCAARGPRGIGCWPATASIRREDRPGEPFILRTWRPGDRIAPSGMTGSRKVQDIFVDQHVPRELRRFHPLLYCGQDLVWLPGYSVSREWLVMSDHDLSYTFYIERDD